MWETLFCAAMMALPLWALYLKRTAPAVQETETRSDFDRLLDGVDDAKRTADELRTVEHMITDIEICSPDKLQQNFTCRWGSAAGTMEHEFWSDGEETSEKLMALAVSERDRLRARLLEQIAELQALEDAA